MVDLTTEEINATSETVKQDPEKKKVVISDRAIGRLLYETNLQYMRPLSRPLLNEQRRQRRVQCAREMKNYDWSLVIASDETMIQLHTSRRFNWQRADEPRFARMLKFSLKVNVWSYFSEQGFGRICYFTHSSNSEFLCNHIYSNALLHSAGHHFAR